MLSIVAVLASLYPASTVLLALAIATDSAVATTARNASRPEWK